MKVRHCISPKAGIEEDVKPDVGLTLIASRLAEEVRFPYGSTGWVAARNELSNIPHLPHPMDVVPPCVQGVEWSVGKLLDGQVVVTRKTGCETWRFRTPPKECPDSIVKVFKYHKALNAQCRLCFRAGVSGTEIGD